PTAMRLAEAAAVLGRESDLALLVAVSGVGESEALDGMQELRTRQVLAATETAEFRFVHDKLREIAHSGIPEERRRQMHQAAADVARPTPTSNAGFAMGLLAQVLVRMLPRPLWWLRAPRTPLRRALTVEAANVLNRMFDALLWNNEALPAMYCGLRGINLA